MGLTIGSSGHRVIGSSEKRGNPIPDIHAALELHIEELVLHGFPAGDRFRIGDAVEQELSRLIAEQGLGLTTAMSMEALDAGSFKIGASARPQSIGVQVARNLHQGLSTAPRIEPQSEHKKKQKR